MDNIRDQGSKVLNYAMSFFTTESKQAIDASKETTSTSGTNEPTTMEYPHINYSLELTAFMNRNAPAGFNTKFTSMAPFLGLSFVSWPAYWLYRGYQWHYARDTERIGVYIQRTFQRAKFLQVAIIAAGLVTALSQERNTLKLEEVARKF